MTFIALFATGLASRGRTTACSRRPTAAADAGRWADKTDNIVKGARPAVLPVEQSTRLEVMLDLTTAKTVVLRMPRSLPVCPDKVIQ